MILPMNRKEFARALVSEVQTLLLFPKEEVVQMVCDYFYDLQKDAIDRCVDYVSDADPQLGDALWKKMETLILDEDEK